MYILENVPLSGLSTMRLGGIGKFQCIIENKDELKDAVNWAREKQLSIKVIGDGSNVIWSDSGYDGLIIVNRLPGFEITENDDDNVYVTIGAGENWDYIVEKTVDMGLSGIEQLSLIPGTVGATPVQNVGAYGREISDVLMTVEAYDINNLEFITFMSSDLELGYRTSIFKTKDKDRYIISSITLRLSRINPMPPFYSAIESYFKDNDLVEYNADNIRKAVIEIRNSKLPNPKITANNGSFFQNPIVDQELGNTLVKRFGNIPHWRLENGEVKLSAAWLIEKAGFPKGYKDPETGMSLWKNQALVLVNENAKSTQDLIDFRNKILISVKELTGINLKQEPEII